MPPDTNNHNTLFGGKLMAYIDDIGAVAAMKHSRSRVVTASTDSIDFLRPIKVDYEVCLEAFVTWTHRTSMEVFVKVIAENMLTGERDVCATSFLTYVAIDDNGMPSVVPGVIPESEEEIFLNKEAPQRAEARRHRRVSSQQLAQLFGMRKPWE
jgi:acyl-CoA hydrolase